MSNVCALVLDIGGVLEDTPATGWEQAWARRLGLEPHDFLGRIESILEPGELGKVGYDRIPEQVAGALDLGPSESAALWDDLWVEYLGTLNTQLLEYVSRLRPTLKVGLLSNSFVGAREREEDAYGFSRHVDAIIYSHEVGLAKPDPRIYLLACDRLGVEPHQVAFVDDHEICVTVARELGMTGVLFTTEDDTIAAIDAILNRG